MQVMYAVVTTSVRFCYLFRKASIPKVSAGHLHSATKLPTGNAQVAGRLSNRSHHETATDGLQFGRHLIQDTQKGLLIFRAKQSSLVGFQTAPMVAVFCHCSGKDISD